MYVLTVQADAGSNAWVNPSGLTVGVAFDPHSISSVLLYEYTVSVEPADILNGSNVTGTVRIYVNGSSDGHSSCGDPDTVDRTPNRLINNKAAN